MLVIYPLLGVTAFQIVEEVVKPTSETLFLKGKDAIATGIESPDGFIVFANSLARVEETPTLHDFVRNVRRELVKLGVLSPRNGQFVFTQDYRFESPSTAAMVVLGRVSNGRREWRDEAGRMLKEIQTAAIGPETHDDFIIDE
jgi:Domain of unknown function (DUF4357)